jgi:oligopeptidase B
MYSKSDIVAPAAKKVSEKLTIHGDTRIDDYYWLNDRENPEVISYLESENDYRDTMLGHTEPFQKKIFDEITGRIKQDDSSVPYLKNGWWYARIYQEGKEYPVYKRGLTFVGAKASTLLDVNALAEGKDYYSVSNVQVSPDNNLLMFAEDTLSRRIYDLRFKDITSGDFLSDVITGTSGNAVWANDNKTIFYVVRDPGTLRAYKLMKHRLGDDRADDELVFEEKDETFRTFVYKTKSEKYIVCGSAHTLSSEYRYLPADKPDDDFRMFQERERDLEYRIYHTGNSWLVLTNQDAKNFRLMSCAESNTTKENWNELIQHRKDVLLEGVEVFNDFYVLTEMKKGIRELKVMPAEGEPYYISFEEAARMVSSGTNYEFATQILRFNYTSLTTPWSVFDFDMKSMKRTLLKEDEVVGGYKKEEYVSERYFVKARDGKEVPVSLVYKKGLKKNGNNPVLLYGYGSYGASMYPYFNSSRLSLLDRGFVFAIAHIRGGEEMGRAWYEDGKLLNKKNTFYDFIDCGKDLIAKNYTSKKHLYGMGGSAGGLLIGAIVNMEPELWNGVVAQVPFVDVVTTMLDESIPLTTFEYDEWGNPNEKEYYDYMKSYSPYDNVKAINYPPMLVTTGLHDSQVQYWEPAKWVAKLRDLKTDNNPLVMSINMEAGHGGASGRFRRHKETAMEYAFLLDLEGISD